MRHPGRVLGVILAAVRGLVVTGAALTLLGPPRPPPRFATYTIPWLVAVIDAATNETTLYQYDAAGNLLAIGRQSASDVAIIDFSPSKGPIGTTVRIQGTGFTATPTSNTVSFDGTAANVTSSTSTEIVAVVPAGAITGAISVTTPGGSATSGTGFMVSGSAAPTIMSFTPEVGAAGTAVTITGTNFEDLPAVTPQGETYAPRWNLDEVWKLRLILGRGIDRLRVELERDQDPPPDGPET